MMCKHNTSYTANTLGRCTYKKSVRLVSRRLQNEDLVQMCNRYETNYNKTIRQHTSKTKSKRYNPNEFGG